MNTLLEDKSELFKRFGQIKMISCLNLDIIKHYAINILNSIRMYIPNKNSIMKTLIIDAPGNSEIL